MKRLKINMKANIILSFLFILSSTYKGKKKSLIQKKQKTEFNIPLRKHELFQLVQAFNFIVIGEALKCWGPKMEWTDYVPTIHYNKFEVVECNKGLQLCSGGCTHCINITGSFMAKSCAGEEDQGLSILGMTEDGCKKITDSQNAKYTNWMNRSLKQESKYSLVADFTQACRCSSDGCNGSPEETTHDRQPRKASNTYNLNQVSSGYQILAVAETRIMLFSLGLLALNVASYFK